MNVFCFFKELLGNWSYLPSNAKRPHRPIKVSSFFPLQCVAWKKPVFSIMKFDSQESRMCSWLWSNTLTWMVIGKFLPRRPLLSEQAFLAAVYSNFSYQLFSKLGKCMREWPFSSVKLSAVWQIALKFKMNTNVKTSRKFSFVKNGDFPVIFYSFKSKN